MVAVVKEEKNARRLIYILVFSKCQLMPNRIVARRSVAEIWNPHDLHDRSYDQALQYASKQGWVELRGPWVRLTPKGYKEA